jgi:hypothetical protein
MALGGRLRTAEREAKREMADDPAGFGQMGKGTEGWRRVAALAGMAATWKKIPDKWAPCGSVCGEYGRRARARIFSETQINLQFDFTFV